jgi:uncharacterized membrane protein
MFERVLNYILVGIVALFILVGLGSLLLGIKKKESEFIIIGAALLLIVIVALSGYAIALNTLTH